MMYDCSIYVDLKGRQGKLLKSVHSPTGDGGQEREMNHDDHQDRMDAERPHTAVTFPLCYTSLSLRSLSYPNLAAGGDWEGQTKRWKESSLGPTISPRHSGDNSNMTSKGVCPRVPEGDQQGNTCPRTRNSCQRSVESRCCMKHVGWRKRCEGASLISKTKTLKEGRILKV